MSNKTNKSQKLTIKKIYESVEKYDEKIRVDFEDGSYVHLFPYISPVNVTKILQTLAEDLNKYSEIGIELEDKLYDDYIAYCIIKTQSDLYIPKNTKDEIQFFKALINSPYYLEIVQYFDRKEIQKVHDKLFDVQLQQDKLQRLMEDKLEEVKGLDLQSPELRERIFGSGSEENSPKH